MQITFSNNLELTTWEKQRITCFCEITGEHENVSVREDEEYDDSGVVVAYDNDTGSVIAYFDVTDEDDTVEYLP